MEVFLCVVLIMQAYIGVYNMTGSCQTVTVIEGMTAMTVCYVLMERNSSDMTKHWVLVEQLPDVGIGEQVIVGGVSINILYICVQ